MFIIRVLISILDHLESRVNSKFKNVNLIFGEDYVEGTKTRAIDSELDTDIYILSIFQDSQVKGPICIADTILSTFIGKPRFPRVP